MYKLVIWCMSIVTGAYIGSVLALGWGVNFLPRSNIEASVRLDAIRDLESSPSQSLQGSTYQLQNANWTQPEDEFDVLYVNDFQLQ